MESRSSALQVASKGALEPSTRQHPIKRAFFEVGPVRIAVRRRQGPCRAQGMNYADNSQNSAQSGGNNATDNASVGPEGGASSARKASKESSMKSPRCLLLLEDNPDDTILLTRHLSAVWPQCEIMAVSNEEDFRAGLKAGGFDLILSDYMVPGFEGPAALALALAQWPGVPFLFISGAIGDEVAIESLKAGATDYVLKDRLPRLVPAIQRALKQ